MECKDKNILSGPTCESLIICAEGVENVDQKDRLLENNRKLPYHSLEGKRKRGPLSAVGCKQVSQDELASDKPPGVWTGTYMIQQNLEVWLATPHTFSWKSQIFPWRLNKKQNQAQTHKTLLTYHWEGTVKNKIGDRGQFLKNLLIKMCMYINIPPHTHTRTLLQFLSLFVTTMKTGRWNLDFIPTIAYMKMKQHGVVRSVDWLCLCSDSWCCPSVLWRWYLKPCLDFRNKQKKTTHKNHYVADSAYNTI